MSCVCEELSTRQAHRCNPACVQVGRRACPGMPVLGPVCSYICSLDEHSEIQLGLVSPLFIASLLPQGEGRIFTVASRTQHRLAPAASLPPQVPNLHAKIQPCLPPLCFLSGSCSRGRPGLRTCCSVRSIPPFGILLSFSSSLTSSYSVCVLR